MEDITNVSLPSRLAVVGVVFAVCLGLAAWGGNSISGSAPWYSVVPPLLAVCLAFITQKVIFSLAVSVFVGGLLAITPTALTSVGWVNRLAAGPSYVVAAAIDPTNLQILGFVVLVMGMIAVLIRSGGLQGIVNKLVHFAYGLRSTQLVTAVCGLLFFIDDYANTMIIGNTLRPVTDKQRISREKLAFIVDATSAPVAGLAVISTWIGYEVGLFGTTAQSLGINRDGYALFFDALPFRFYCILMIVFVLANALSGTDYGPMEKAQARARHRKKLLADDATPMTSQAFSSASPSPNARIRMFSAVVPIGALFVILIGGLWFDGGGMAKLEESQFAFLSLSNWREVMSASLVA